MASSPVVNDLAQPPLASFLCASYTITTGALSQACLPALCKAQRRTKK